MGPREAGLEYATRHGWRVLPLRRDSKIPASQHGLYDATRDSDVIASWSENVNVAIAAGDPIALDIDFGRGIDGSEVLLELERRHGRLPRTVTALTPSGEHRYFTCERSVLCSVARLGPTLDVRGAGGYVVAPPSVVGSRAYAWEIAPDELEPAPLPAWLERLLTDSCSARRATPARDWRRLTREGVTEGARNDRCAVWPSAPTRGRSVRGARAAVGLERTPQPPADGGRRGGGHRGLDRAGGAAKW